MENLNDLTDQDKDIDKKYSESKNIRKKKTKRKNDETKEEKNIVRLKLTTVQKQTNNQPNECVYVCVYVRLSERERERTKWFDWGGKKVGRMQKEIKVKER